jgi:hypothetical protein
LDLKVDLIDPCANLRMGTAIFAKILRIVAKLYGNPTNEEVFPQLFDDAVHAWQTGKFEGEGVFQAQDLSSRSLLQVPGKGPIVSRTPVRICVEKRQSQTMLESVSTSPASEVQGNDV